MAADPGTDKRHLLPGTAPLTELTDQLHERRDAANLSAVLASWQQRRRSSSARHRSTVRVYWNA